MRIPTYWTFRSDEVADGFDSHVREQLPWYELATCATCHIAASYLPESGRIYDIGASTGNIGRGLVDVLAARSADLVAVEASPEMASRYAGGGTLIVQDACSVEYQPFDVAIMFLALQFVPVARRGRLITTLRERCRQGGALVVVDRFDDLGGYASRVLYRLGLAAKIAGGATPEEIIEKEISLAGAQRPLRVEELPGAVEWFRMGDFRGLIVER